MRQTLPIHRFFTTILFLAITTLTWAYDFAVDGIYYDKNTDGTSVTVTYKTSSDRGYSSSVVIPSTVTYSGKTYSVTSIGESAFFGCSGLTSVTIPNSVTSIGSYAFSYCSGMTSVVVDKNNPKYDSRNDCNAVIESETNSLIVGCKNTVIPNSVTSIGSYAFSGCSGLTSVTIPNSVTNIGYIAFDGCSGLTSVTIPESVTSIGDEAFAFCTGLTSVTIGSGVTSIGKYAFYSCSSLTSVTLNSNSIVSKTYTYNNNIGTIFGSQVKEYILGDNITAIGNCAFSGCTGLTKAEFASIESLCKIKFSDSESNPLYYAKHLYIDGQEVTDVVIPNSVTSIGNYAFSGCQLQTIINHCDNDIAKNVFSDRVYLHTQLYVPEGTVWDYIFNTGWGEFHHIKEFATSAEDIRNDAVYMIADRSGRNFPVYDKSAKTLKKVAYTLNLDDSDTGACWQVIRNGSDTYLYNIGAGMYAAYDADDDLSLSIVPTALAIDMTEDGATINGKPVMLVANKSVTPIDNPTGIDTLQADEAEDSATQTVSHDDTSIYDLHGRRMHEKPAHGFYIRNGKKYYGK